MAIVTERLASLIFEGSALGQSLRVSAFGFDEVEANVRIVGIVESPVERSGQDGFGVVAPSRSGEVAAAGLDPMTVLRQE